MLKKLLVMAVLAVSGIAMAANPKYVFLFIGDGMSIPQRTITEEYLKKTSGKELLINHFPAKAATKTSAANSFITDSAASGTAIACGEKTKNGRIGMNVDATRNLVSTAYVAKEAGKKVGIITSVTINHATPASFYAHRPNRGQYYEIGLDLIASNFDFFGGGGASNSNDEKCGAYKGDLYELAEKAGYTVAFPKTVEELNAIKNEGKIWVRGSAGSLPTRIDVRGEESVQLCDFVRKGIEVLDNPNGFFMMCEGGAIDWGGHANDAGYVLGEALALDEAVRVAYEFGLKHPEETLIVVTGDHETGGLTLGLANTGIKSSIELLGKQRRSSGSFGWTVVDKLRNNANYSFEEMKPFLSESFGFEFTGDSVMALTADEINSLKGDFDKLSAASAAYYAKKKAQADSDTIKKFSKERENACKKLVSNVMRTFGKRTGLSYSTGGHSALPVITTAWGCGSENFNGKLAGTVLERDMKEYNNYSIPVANAGKIAGDYNNSDIAIKLKALVK